MREPSFWWRDSGPASALLAPASWCYGKIAARRMARRGTRAGVPVICVGNFTLGGTGKTPTAIALAGLLQNAGERVVFLSRGYGGRERGPHLVDAQADKSVDVGDEPLLLARTAPTVIARDRPAGAALAKAQGATVIVMDDGLQNGSLAKDFTLAVIDARRGIGNGCVFPGGPLRAPLDAQLKRTDALLVIGDGDNAVPDAAKHLPVFRARLVPDAAAIGALKARKVLAFAGIGDPEKFFATVKAAGIAVAQEVAFPDHHRLTPEEAANLMMRADGKGLALLTTEKDRARMNGDALLESLATRLHVLPVTLEIAEAEKLLAAVMKAVKD
jgi:tetraacyldisaccharide 4'-kinase